MMTLIAYSLGRLHERKLRGGSGLCYALPQTYSVGVRRGNKPFFLKSLVNTSKLCQRVLFTTPLSLDYSGSLTPQQIYTHTAHGCWDELNGGQTNEA